MSQIDHNSTGNLILSTQYSSSGSIHIDLFFCGGVNMWRDAFTQQQLDTLIGCAAGETVTLEQNYQVIPFESALIRRVPLCNWSPPQGQFQALQPLFGRWYPGGYIRSLPGIFPQSTRPVRIVGIDDKYIEVDCNHPLAGKGISLSMTVDDIRETKKERGGRCTDWIDEALTNGPGIELFPNEGEVYFDQPDKMARLDDDNDTLFYQNPRLVNHIDIQALKLLSQLSGEFITDDMRVLDLMSSVQSHLPPGPSVTGLGMNIEEMRANPTLTDHLVHDLNSDATIPLEEQSFEVICCHLSIEYLLQPQHILRECARLLTDQGCILISFSNRWFPEKVTLIWQTLHEFERVGYVMKYVAEEFTDIRTFSYRNWPRPHDDPYYMQLQTSDPVFIVVAKKK